MGRLVESLAADYDCVIAGVVEIDNAHRLAGGLSDEWGRVDVAVDFSYPSTLSSARRDGKRTSRRFARQSPRRALASWPLRTSRPAS
jgi:hypothetical protein